MEQLASIRDVSPNSSNRKDLIEQIQVLIEENIYKPELSVTFLADQVHLSVNYLRNIFKDSTGSSLSNYINNRKIDVICRFQKAHWHDAGGLPEKDAGFRAGS